MTGRGHVALGTAATFLVLASFKDHISVFDLGISLSIGTITSLLPDLDGKHSLLKETVLAKGRATIIPQPKRNAALIEQAILQLLSAVEIVIRLCIYTSISIPSMLLEHRHMTHYLITPSILFTVCIILSNVFSINYVYSFVFLAAYISHILGDMMTYSGVAALQPFFSKKLFLLPKKLRFAAIEKHYIRGKVYVKSTQSEIVVLLISCAITIACVLLIVAG